MIPGCLDEKDQRPKMLDPLSNLSGTNPLPVFAQYEAGQQKMAKSLFGFSPSPPAIAKRRFPFKVYLPTGAINCEAVLHLKFKGILKEDQRLLPKLQVTFQCLEIEHWRITDQSRSTLDWFTSSIHSITRPYLLNRWIL